MHISSRYSLLCLHTFMLLVSNKDHCIVGNFSQGPNVFTTHDQNAKKKKTQKFEHVKFCVNFSIRGNFHTCILCASLAQSDDGTVSLFKTAHNVLPSPMGYLSTSVSQVMIKAVRGVINSSITQVQKLKRENFF